MFFKSVKPLEISLTFFPPYKKAGLLSISAQPCHLQCSPFSVEGQGKGGENDVLNLQIAVCLGVRGKSP